MAKARKACPQMIEQAPLSQAMQQMLASLHLEGIELSPEAMFDVQLFDAGQITKEEFLRRAIGRAKSK